MINKINILSIKILNSKYKHIFLLLLYFSIYYFNICLYETYSMGSLFSAPTESLLNVEESKREIVSFLECEIRVLEERRIENNMLENLYTSPKTFQLDVETYNKTRFLYEKNIETKQFLLNELQTPGASSRLFEALLADQKANAELERHLFSIKK